MVFSIYGSINLKYTVVKKETVPTKFKPLSDKGYVAYIEFDKNQHISYYGMDILYSNILRHRGGWRECLSLDILEDAFHSLTEKRVSSLCGNLRNDGIDDVILDKQDVHHHDPCRIREELIRISDEYQKMQTAHFYEFTMNELEKEYFSRVFKNTDGGNRGVFSNVMVDGCNIFELINRYHDDLVVIPTKNKLDMSFLPNHHHYVITEDDRELESSYPNVERVRIAFTSIDVAEAFVSRIRSSRYKMSIHYINHVSDAMVQGLQHKSYGVFISKRTQPIRIGDLAYLTVKLGCLSITFDENDSEDDMEDKLIRANEAMHDIYQDHKAVTDANSVKEPLLQVVCNNYRVGTLSSPNVGYITGYMTHHDGSRNLSDGFCQLESTRFIPDVSRSIPRTVLKRIDTRLMLSKMGGMATTRIHANYKIHIPISDSIPFENYSRFLAKMTLTRKIAVDSMSLMLLPFCSVGEVDKDLISLLDALT